MTVNVVHALLLMGAWQAIQGLGVWVGRLVGVTPPFIMAAEEQAKSRCVVCVVYCSGDPLPSTCL